MSFSAQIKEEISKLNTTKTEDIAELSAIIRNSESLNNINIVTENRSVANRVYNLIKKIYNQTLTITIRKRSGFSTSTVYILNLNENYKQILKDLSIIDNDNNYLSYPKEYLIGDSEEIRAYLKGLFEVCGSISDPKTSGYHLEFIINEEVYAKKIMELLNNFDLNSKVIKREKNYKTQNQIEEQNQNQNPEQNQISQNHEEYISHEAQENEENEDQNFHEENNQQEEQEKISDFLRIIKAYNAVMYFEDIRIYRDYKNMSNRLNNCEIANMDKIFQTANNQIKDIEKLEKYDIIDTLDDKLKEAINYRLQYKESSLQELADIMSNELNYNISKSGLNHRFRKIKEIINKIEKNKC